MGSKIKPKTGKRLSRSAIKYKGWTHHYYAKFSTWLLSGSSVQRMRRFAFLFMILYALHNYGSIILQDVASSSSSLGFSSTVQQIINDQTGDVVGSITEKKVPIEYSTNIGTTTRETYIREAVPAEEPIPDTPQSSVVWVFLHGALHDSKVWIKNGVVELLITQGFKAIALDMPGFGSVADQRRVPANQMVTFLEALRVELGMEKIVLVSPVMSGKFSLPWLMNGGKHIVGFVAIDTIETERYPDEQYQAIQIPILLLFGERDPVGQTAKKKLSLSSNFRFETIPSFGPNWYQEKTRDLKKHLTSFIGDLMDYMETILPPPVMNAQDQMALVTGDNQDQNLGENLSVGQVQPALPVETQ